ncbi:pyridoxamine 5'-phosphate oxidase family protein [Crenobacter sp. SG2303]|uniref:Pyridoxamine 5'-phosphate oxidase family protein n=1 Tax=Crenobacter oryzisoli TaxID=3056844 RepID=A0ABT7XRB7_9NEIS|nr:pyridoxamine 5'-phosphate oxidase family protein [Crenobacter sp. SG2303]MDN0076119.1 pyridoxamine 5'-phosphate oxidase family protein [Crenobacter sp. SG2303]
MDDAARQRVLDVMNSHNLCTIATVRADGYPQATTVAYVNDDLTLYLCCDVHAQKLRNIRLNNKVSLTINRYYTDWREIRGLSLGGLAEEVQGRGEIEQVLRLMLAKFPQFSDLAQVENLANVVAVIKVTPQVISLLDYRQGFGHTEYLEV